MAKTAGAPGAATAEEPAKKSGKKSWIIGGVVGLLALAGGAVVPMFVHFGAHATTPEPEVSHDAKTVIVPFDSVVVNVADGRYTRYLRVRIALVVEAKDESSVKEVLEKSKPYLQT